MKQLSRIPSKLIRLALKDLKLVENDSRYAIKMDTLHQSSHSKCNVCLAGSVLAKTFNVPIKIDLGLEVNGFINEDSYGKLKALDRFREGRIVGGLYMLDIIMPLNTKEVIDMPLYEEGPEKFKEALENLAYSFEMRGL